VETLKDQMEKNYDPSDVDGAMQLAYETLHLCKLAKLAIDSNQVRLLMGHNLMDELASQIMIIARKLGLLEHRASGASCHTFFEQLKEATE